MQIALSIVTYIISSGMSVFGVSVQRKILEIMSLLTSNTPSSAKCKSVRKPYANLPDTPVDLTGGHK
jgi:hypothetical protein